MNSNDRFEILAMLYKRRCGKIAPGKDRPAALEVETEAEIEGNHERWRAYCGGMTALTDALEHIHRLSTVDLADLTRQLEAAKLTIAGLNDTGKLVTGERDDAVALLVELTGDVQEYHDSFAKPPVKGRLASTIRKARALLERIGGAK